MSNNKAIYTIAVGANYHKLAKITVPTMEAYAKKVGADVFVLDESDMKGEENSQYKDPFSLKYKCMLEAEEKGYERMLFLDIDVYIRPDSPDIFEIYPNSGMRPTPVTPPHNAKLHNFFKWARKYWDDADEVLEGIPYYYNTGVIIFNKDDLKVLNEHLKPPYIITHFSDTWVLNYMFYKHLDKIDDYHHRWNYNPSVRGYKEFQDACFVEYCRSGVDKRIFQQMEKDLEQGRLA